MNRHNMELNRLDGQFKEAVLETVQDKARAMIAEAERKRAQVLHQARLQSAVADHDRLAAEYERKTEQRFAAAEQATRRQLLQHRQLLAQQVFAEAERKLEAFTAGDEYGPWLVKKLTEGAGQAGEEAIILLRPQDMHHAAILQKALPGSTVRRDECIRLGGLKLVIDNRLHDQTLDAALKEQRQVFYATSGLTV